MELVISDRGVTPVSSYEESVRFQTELIWQQLEKITLKQAAEIWLTTLSYRTQRSYKSRLKRLADLGYLNFDITLQAFCLIKHDAIIDRIKLENCWSECSRQAKAACYISFTRFLNRRSQGIIKKAIPNREGNSKTFFKVYDKIKTNAIRQPQWLSFLESLKTISPREYLIAKVILQGGKRVSEVLSLKLNQIDWERCKISFNQSKTKGLQKSTVITYPQSIMNELKTYVGLRSEGNVFVTRTGKPVQLNRLSYTFEQAGKNAGLSIKVTPHVLRASVVTFLKKQGFHDSEIMKVTGHANPAMVHAYDKNELEDNLTEKLSLVT